MSGNQIETSIIVDLVGNLERQLKRNTTAVNKFSRNAGSCLDSVDKKVQKTTSSYSTLGKRLVALAAGMKAVREAKKVMDFDTRLTRLQTDSRVTPEQINSMKAELFKVANDPNIRLPKEDILSGFEETIAMTGDWENAKKNLQNMALFMQATATEGKDAGTMIGIAFKNGTTEASEVLNLLEIQYKQSLQGAVPIRDLATTGKGLVSPVTSAVGSTPDVLTDATAVAQITIDATKNADMTAEAVKAFMSALNNADTQKKFRGAGVEFRQPNSTMLRKPSGLIPEIYDRVKGDFSILNKYFGESGVKVFQGFAKPGGRERLKEFASMTGDGSTIRNDARINAQSPNAALQSIQNKGSQLTDSVMSDSVKVLASSIDTFQTTDAATNIKGIGYAALATAGTLADKATGYSALKYYFDNAIKSIVNSNFVEAMSTDNTPEGIAKFNRLAGTVVEPKANATPQRSIIELQIKSEAPVIVKSIKSDNLDLSVDTGKVMP